MISAKVRITILVDSHAGDGLSSEHGLSLSIEAEGMRILFDTGARNRVGIQRPISGRDLGETDMLVLSHGHYDHTLKKSPSPYLLANSTNVMLSLVIVAISFAVCLCLQTA